MEPEDKGSRSGHVAVRVTSRRTKGFSHEPRERKRRKHYAQPPPTKKLFQDCSWLLNLVHLWGNLTSLMVEGIRHLQVRTWPGEVRSRAVPLQGITMPRGTKTSFPLGDGRQDRHIPGAEPRSAPQRSGRCLLSTLDKVLSPASARPPPMTG